MRTLKCTRFVNGLWIKSYAFFFIALVIGDLLSAGNASAQDHPDDIYWDDTFFEGYNINGVVQSIAVKDSNVYIGGEFVRPFTEPTAKNIVKFTNGNWSVLESGIDSGIVRVITCNNNDVYVGGHFVSADSIVMNNIARWDGQAWNTLGTGVNGYVSAIVVRDTDVYVAGGFDTAGGIRALNIAKWNGHQWSSLDSGVNGYVYALAILGDTIVVGGDFSLADTISANNIAMWDGQDWQQMESGTDNTVYAVEVVDSVVYIGGRFESAGGIPANHIVTRKNGVWSMLDTGIYNGVDGSVIGIRAVNSTEVYIAGIFSRAGDADASNIALWDSLAWSALGSGSDGAVLSVATYNDDVYIGGNFQRAGGESNVGAFINRWNKPPDTLGLTISRRGGSQSDVMFDTKRGAEFVKTVEFSVPRERKVIVSLYDKNGNVLKTVSDNILSSDDILNYKWDASDLSVGEYFLTVKSGENTKVKKIVVR